MTEEMRVCNGCGASLQTEDQNQPGYVPKSALDREDVVCRRCFRITHYSEVAQVDIGEDDFLRILNTIGETESLVVKVIDIFDFNGSWLRGLSRFVGNNPILLVGNKVDLLPQKTNPNRVINWMQQAAKELGLKPVDVVLVSAKTGEGFQHLVSAMGEYRAKKDVYVVGATNVGKSSVINRLLHDYGEAGMEITTSRFPGTTLDMIHIPLEDDTAIIDTPGIINRDQIGHRVSPATLKTISPEQRINPRVYQLNDQQTLFLGGLVRIDFIQGERQPFVLYVSNLLDIHRTKLEKADQLYENHKGELLSPPNKEELEQLPPMKKHHFKIPAGEEQDLVISGLGWLALTGEGAILDVYAPEGVGIGLRRKLI